MNDNESALAKCPFYRKTGDRFLVCESCVERTRLVLSWPSRREMIDHKRVYCDTYDWEECGYAKIRLGENRD